MKPVPSASLPPAPSARQDEDAITNDTSDDESVYSTANASAPNDLQSVRAEIEMLKAQEELLKMRARVAEMQRNVCGAETRRINKEDVEFLVSTFSGDDDYGIIKWFQDFDDIMNQLNGNDEDKYRMARHLIRDTARIYLRTIRVQNYDELRRAMLQRYDRQITTSEVLRKLDRRVKLPDENILHYITCMQEISQQANVSEFELVIKIVSGLRDTASGMISLLGTARTIEQLISLLPMYEHMVAVSGRAQPKRNTIPSATTISNTKSVATNQHASADQPGGAVRCFNCGQFGHMAAVCPKPRRAPGSCFTCGSMEHHKQQCPKRRNLVASAVGTAEEAAVEYEDELADAISRMPLVSVSFKDHHGNFTKSRSFHALIDSGSPVSFVRRSALPSGFAVSSLRKSKYFGIRNVPIYIHELLNCQLNLNDRNKIIKINVVPDDFIPFDVLLGRDVLDDFKIDYYFRDHVNKLKFGTAKWRSILPRRPERDKADRSNKSQALSILKPVSHCNTTPAHPEEYFVDTVDSVYSDSVGVLSSAYDFSCDANLRIDHNMLFGNTTNNNSDYSIEHDCEINEIDPNLLEEPFDIGPALPTEVNKEVQDIILKNYINIDQCSVNVPHYEMNIHLSDDVPIYSHPRRLSHSEKNEVNNMVEDLLNQGVIRHSESPYASPIVLIKKKNGRTRLCIDYRPLNKKTVRDNYPMPIVEDCIEYLCKKTVFTLLDLKSGFHQVKMAESSQKYTSFVTPCGQYEYLKMPFGLTNAPAVFQRFINHILKEFIVKREIVVYMDDILIASSSVNEHKNLLIRVLHCIATNGLELQLSKCKFLYEELEYLGYIVSAEGIRPGRKKVDDILKYPVPTTVQSVHSFVSLCSFFRRFVPRFSQLARPLYRLLQKDVPFVMDSNCLAAFENLKDILTSEPVLGIYNPANETELHTDASKIGYGAVLFQKQSDNKFHPIAYFSKSVSKHEVNYHSYELETLAIVYALGRFRTYLAGIPFTIVTDCNSLVMTFQKKDVNSRIARWVWEFEKFNYKIKHRSGEQMKHADALSRNISMVAYISSHDLYHQLNATQNRDVMIKNLKETLETSESPPYEMHNGIVYRKSKENKLLFYVPKEMELQLIQSVHEKIGHFGSFKCLEKLKTNYWFPGMRAKVDSFVKNCIKCIVYSSPNRASERTLHSIPKKPVPFDTIHIDHFGPLPSINSKQKHLLVVIDAFTKFVKVYPATSTSTKEVCRTLEKYFEFYSRPARIISDRGTCFTSNEFIEFVDKHNIQHIKNAVASPQANGQVERVNRVLKNMLGKLTEPLQHSDWVHQIKHVEYAINNTIQKSVGISPSMLLFGVQQRGPNVDYLAEFLEGSDLNKEERDLDSLRSKSAENIKNSQKSSHSYSLRNSCPTQIYAEGDYIVVRYIDTSAGNKKFTQKFRGPYVVHKVLPNDRYVVRDIDGSQITQLPYDNVIEAKNIKYWRK